MSFERARAVADAVLFEGYVLYPYRASSTKNRYRWTFGVLAPQAWSAAGGCEPSWMEAQCLLEPGTAARLDGRLRLMQMQRRRVEEATARAGTSFRPVESLEVDGELKIPWEEGRVREVALRAELFRGRHEVEIPFEIPAGHDVEPVRDRRGAMVGRVTLTRWALQGLVRIAAEPVAALRPLVRLRIRVDNQTPWHRADASRSDALGASLLSTHLMLSLSDGAFVSLHDPPEWAREAADSCRSVRSHPVLAGEPGQRDLLLSTPIILHDHPQIAPESPGDFFDATEIDELLALRTSMLTDDEKRQARATDPRAAEVVDRVEAMSAETMERLHGAIRDNRGAEEDPPAAQLRPGRRVRLRPGRHRTDVQDMLFEGCSATIVEIRHDVDGRQYLAVTIDDDPASELNFVHGRFHYYRRDEVEVLDDGAVTAGGE